MTTSKSARPSEPVISYRIRVHDARAHLFEVRLRVERPDPAGQRLSLPIWIPGSYLVREFARNIVEIRAETVVSGKRRTLALEKQDKHTWQAAPCTGAVTVTYLVYAWDTSVRAAHLDPSHAFFNGTSVYLRVIGQDHLPHEVEIVKPGRGAQSRWRVATTLPEQTAARYGFGVYRASSYDELVDHPVEMGHFELGTYSTAGASHDVAISGAVPNLDMARLCRDLQQLCHAQIALFEPSRPRAPFKRFAWLVTAVSEGYGGLEHRASTALLCARRGLPVIGESGIGDAYFRFLGLASHEYFHCWNVKRIKPAAFAPYDFDRENYTSLLWIFEGFTSYYDDLILTRCGLIPEQRYLQALARTISDVRANSGRKRQSVAESSFDAWIKYYRPDENSGNAVVSYYKKGALVGLALDLTIRLASRGRRSLDDVMRTLWGTYGRNFYSGAAAGLSEDGFARLAREATGIDISRLVRQWAYGTVDPPLEQLLRPFGITLTMSAGGVESSSRAARGGVLGITTTAESGLCRIASVAEQSPGYKAGLAAGDYLVALGGLRVGADGPAPLLERYAPGNEVEVHVFRRDELHRLPLRIEARSLDQCTLVVGGAANRLRRSWLG